MKRKIKKNSYLYIADLLGGDGIVSFLLDASYLCKKLQCLQLGVCSEAVYLIPNLAELCGCFYGSTPWGIFYQYVTVHSDNHSDYAGGDDFGGICICQTGF